MAIPFVLLALVVAVELADSGPNTSPLDSICADFKNFDQNHDGQPEIRTLRPIASVGETGPRVIMLVEPRLLERMAGVPPLEPLLVRWANDVASEGYRADVIAAKLAPSKVHQDGRFILAIREFLRAADRQSNLAGVVLVGHFPDAYLVRTCNWRKGGDITLHSKTPQQQTYKAAPYIRRVPEGVAQRADIVLSDLDGRWENVYVQPSTPLPSVIAVFAEKVPAGGGPCVDVEKSSKTVEDVFHISDGRIDVAEADAFSTAAAPNATIVGDDANHECASADEALPNIMSRPDIFVSRLDARGIALQPSSKIVGNDRAKLLDVKGQPQAVQFDSAKEVPRGNDSLWEADPKLERKLLAEYFDRNHSYRTGTAKIAWRASSIACQLPSGYRSMRPAAANWEAGDPKLADIRGNPSLVDFVDWIKYPAVLRTIRAHSYPLGSQFKKTDIAQLDASLGGPAWSWTRKGDRLEPSLASACGSGMLNWSLLHSLYENGQISPQPCFYEHGGCDAISPYGAPTLPYDHPQYGKRQGAESLLFFGNGLALLGRAKVYYDDPAGFAQTLREGQTFGAAWAKYYELESQGISARGAGEIGRKRAYFWSVLGDWTLKLSTAAPKKTS